MTEQILKQDVMIDGQQVMSIATPDIVNNHVAETTPLAKHAVEVDPMKLQVMQNAVAKIEKAFGTWAWAAIRAAASWRSTAPSRRARPHWRSTP